MESFGNRLRIIREAKGLLLRQMASKIEIDQALLSKIERSERVATRNQVQAFAKLFELDQNELLALWMGEKIAYELKDEVFANDAIKVAEQTIHYLNNSRNKQVHV